MRPTIDYTNKDYNSLRRAIFELARYRLPEWTDQSPADLGALMVDLFSYVGDVVLYYQDRIANESFLHTALERRSVMHLLRLIGYELAPPSAASAELVLTFKPPPPGPTTVTIPSGAEFLTRELEGTTHRFTYLGDDLTLDLASDQVQLLGAGPTAKRVYAGLPVRQSRVVPTEVIGSSTLEPNQRFALSQKPLILDSLVIEVNEGAGWVTWDRRQSLLYDIGPDGRVTLSSSEARHYYVQFDENDVAHVIFGDGVFGMRPPIGTNNVRASYHVGGGTAGNVPAATINKALTTIALLDSVTNPLPAAGGTDHEDLDHATRFGPLSFRSAQRAVTQSDYVTLAQQAGGVAKVRARSTSWNTVELFIAPEGSSLRPVPEDLKRRLIAFFEDKRMTTVFVRILDATAVPIDITMEIITDPRHRADAVRQASEATVADLLAFRNVDFGQPVYLSDVYGRVEVVPGVLAVNITRFRRQGSTIEALEEELRRAGLPRLDALPELLRSSIQVDVAADGRIEIGDFELATLGTLGVTVKDS
jgi:uncharacterized phage protein gp47/JayE